MLTYPMDAFATCSCFVHRFSSLQEYDMPTPPLLASDQRVIDALRAWDAAPEPRIKAHICRQMDPPVDFTTFSRRLSVGLASRNEDPAIRSARQAINTNMTPSLAWAKTSEPDENGMTYSVMLRPDVKDDTIDRIRDAFDDIQAAPQIIAPTQHNKDLLNLYPLFDVHLSMKTTLKETGEDYNNEIAMDRIRTGAAGLMAMTQEAETAIILVGGDFNHQDDQTNQTRRSKHQLDVDGRYFNTIECGVAVLDDIVATSLARHNNVIVRILPGNHDSDSSIGTLFGIHGRYIHNDRVEVMLDPREAFAHQHGSTMIAAHHGHRMTPQAFVMFMAAQWRHIWAECRFFYAWSGHKHSKVAMEIGGVLWEQLQAVAPRDAYAFAHGYVSQSSMPAITYHKHFGEIGRVRWPFIPPV